MIDEFEKLAAAGCLVQLEKEAVGGAGVVDAITRAGQAAGEAGRTAYGVIGSGTAGAAKYLKGFGPMGRLAGVGVRAAPWIGGAALLNEALGNPVGKTMQAKRREFEMKRLQHQAVYDPRSGRMY